MATLEQEAHPGARGQSGPIMVGIAGPAPQRRSRVAFRLVLALPHLVILVLLGTGASVVAVIGWAGVLARGHLPQFAAACLSGYTRWACRVAAYLMLLTDAFPPFSSGDEPGYPVGADLSPGRLNRLTAAFRLILGIPATVAAGILAAGSVTVVAPVAWAVTLVAGRLPGPLHHGFAAVLRYLVRCHGYVHLLTGTYPGDLSGGISRGAKRVVTLILVLGMVTAAAAGAVGGICIRSAIARQRAISRLNAEVAEYNAAVARHDSALATAQRALARANTAGTEMSRAQGALNRVLDATGKRMNSCSSAGCFDSLNVSNARAAAAFGRSMRAASIPRGASALIRRLAAETATYQKSWAYMSHATSLTDVQKRARISEETESQFYAADNALAQWLKRRADALQRREAALDQQAATLNRSGVALRVRSATLGVQAEIRTALPSQEPVSSAA